MRTEAGDRQRVAAESHQANLAKVAVSALRVVLRFGVGLMARIAAVGLLVFVAIELSFDGGLRAVLVPIEGAEPSPRDQRLIDDFHLDDHVVIRWLHWLADVAGGDWGTSTRDGMPVTELIGPRLSISGELMLVAVVGSVLIGVGLGLAAAAWAGRRSGRAIDTFLGVSQTVPVFITPLFLIWLFAVELQWLPAAGWVRISVSFSDHLRHLILPAVTLILAEAGPIGRIVRNDVREVLRNDFITAARGKGLSTRYVMTRHALRPGSLGLLNVIGLNIGALLSGAMIVELVFGIPGLGQLLIRGVTGRDLYVLAGLSVYFVTVYVILNTVVDATMRRLDPRIA